MDSIHGVIAETSAPSDRAHELLDVRDLPPPQPLRQTLERLSSVDEPLLVQRNDRRPHHLYPKLDNRGYNYESLETGDGIITVIW